MNVLRQDLRADHRHHGVLDFGLQDRDFYRSDFEKAVIVWSDEWSGHHGRERILRLTESLKASTFEVQSMAPISHAYYSF